MKKVITLFSALVFTMIGYSQTYISEDFSTFTLPVQPPAGSGWKNIDSIPGRMSDSIWRFDNSGARNPSNLIVAPFAVADGDIRGNNPTFPDDCYLVTPNFDASLATVVTLEFDHVYRTVGSDFGEIQVFDGTNWISDTLFTQDTDPNNTDISKHEVIDISQYVAGVSNAQVRFRYNDPNWGWYWILDNITIFQPTPDDASVVSVDSTVAGCGLDSSESIVASIVNAGSTTIQNFPINYTINGGTVVTETVTDSILPGDTLQYSFMQGANFATAGTYNITVYTTVRGDANNVNDTAMGVTVHKQTISSFPYNEGFENGNGGWIPDGANSSWMMGTPAGAIINTAANGVNSYVTNLAGAYNNGEASYVLGPCFDFTNLNAPQFKMNVWWNSESSWDGAVLQMSINNGLSWTQVGALNDPNNWYNDGTINGLQNAGFSGEGWTITGGAGSGGWVLAEHDLTGAANEPSVQLRVFFGSDGFVTDEGFAFDDVLIQEAPAADAGITSFVSPVTNCGLGSADSVCVMVGNFGAASLTNFPLHYEFNGSTFTDTFKTTLNPGDTVMFCFNTAVNVSTPGNYSIRAYTSVPMDGNSLNDTLSNSFDNIPIISGFPYTQGFENGNGGWVPGGANSSWAVTTPAGAVINSAANGINSYTTNIAGTYNANEASFVGSPCFDFTTLNAPQIKMNVWWNSEFSWDGAALQSSIDGGATWQIVGAFGDPNNWYTDGTVNGLQNAGFNGEGWTGRASSTNGSGGWVLAEHDLIGLGNQPAVLLRVFFGSDGSVQDEGFAFDDVLIQDAPAIDGAVAQIVRPNSDCSLTSDSVEIIVYNPGSDTLVNVPVGFSNNGTAFNDTIFGTLLPGDTVSFVFNSLAMLNTPGDYTLKAYTSLVGDGNLLNDTAQKIVTHVPVVSSFPYNEGFETGTGGWLAEGTNSSWQQGPPTNTTIAFAGAGTNAYVTNLSGPYNQNEVSYLVSPCLDFSSLTSDPLIRFRNTYEFGFDGEAWLEQSTDGGATWNKVIDNGGALNWYNNTIDQEWDNTSSAGAGFWVISENVLVGLAGQSNAKLRFVMDGNAFSTGEGIGIDDIFLDLPPASDAGVIALTAPGTNCGFGMADSVKIQVKNFGSDTITTTPVSYSVNGAAAVIEVITAQILPGDTLDYTFTTSTVNLSTTGSYTFVLYTSLVMDGNPTNDTTTTTVENTLQIAPYTENFDSNFVSGTGFNNIGAGYVRGWLANPEPTDFAWGPRTGATGSTGTGPDNDRSITGNYMFVEGSNGATGAIAELTSPCIDLSNLSSPRLSFWYHKFGNNMSDLYVDIYDGTVWTNGVDTIVGQVQLANADTFLLRDVTALTQFAGGNIQVRFRTSGKTGFATDMAIDEFSIYDGPVSVNNIDGGNELGFSIYPNPSEGSFNLVTPSSKESLTVEILDTKGQLVYTSIVNASGSSKSNLKDLNVIAKGIYFVRISDSNTSSIKKLIIQ